MVAASAAALQSLALTQFGCRIKPRQMRRLLVETGIAQGEGTASEHIGPFPNMRDAVDSLVQLANQDCNNNATGDVCEIWEGTGDDCNFNLIPDDCEPQVDCNGNGVQDICDIAAGTSEDCNENGIPDDCEPDCNGNGVEDSCDITGGSSEDCNANGVPDECDIAGGSSEDCNGNGVPDECEFFPAGPCCLPSGDCQRLNECACLAQGGMFLDPGTRCTWWTCAIYGPGPGP